MNNETELTLIVITGAPATGKSMLGRALLDLGAARVDVKDKIVGRSGVCFIETSSMSNRHYEMIGRWREAGAIAHLIETRPSWHRP